MPSRRARSAPQLNEFAILLAEKRANSGSLVDLTLSNPTRASLPYDEAGLRQALAGAEWFSYSPDARGLPSARSQISVALNGLGVPGDPDRMLLTASTSEAYAYLFKLLCDPGDVILAPEPGYPLLSELCRYESVELRHYRLLYDGAWHIDFESLTQALSDRVKAVVVVSPNNPTGSVLKRSELTRLLSLGLPVISDEVFAAYPLQPAPDACSVLELAPEDLGFEPLVFRVDGLSKLLALPQLKLGFLHIAGSAKRVEQALTALEFIADTYLSVNAPVMAAAAELIFAAVPTRQAIQQRLANNLARLDAGIHDTAITRLHLEAGWSAVLSLPLVSADLDWSSELLMGSDLVVQPGWFFDFQDPRLVVVSLLTPEADFAEGTRRIVRAVEGHVGLGM